MDHLDPRRQELWRLHDFSAGRGLEVGPLHDAIVSRDQADVRYVDIMDREGLRAYYGDHPGIPIDDIPEIDYPLTQPDGRIATLAEAAQPGAPFDWVVASHVVEHVPDLVGWLADLAEVVADDGALVLVVPDRRYCFDVHRPPTTVGAMLEAHRLGALRPGVRAVYDHYSQVVAYDVADLWQGRLPDYADRHHSLEDAQAKVDETINGVYVDCHVWLFGPDEFVEQMRELRMIGMSSWYVDRLLPTTENTLEFMVRLRRVPRDHGADRAMADELVTASDRPAWTADVGQARRIDRLGEQIVEHEQRAERYREQVAQLEDVVTGLVERLEQRSGRTRRLRQKVARHQKTIRSQRTRLASMQTQIAAQQAQIEGLQRPLVTRAVRRLRSAVRSAD